MAKKPQKANERPAKTSTPAPRRPDKPAKTPAPKKPASRERGGDKPGTTGGDDEGGTRTADEEGELDRKDREAREEDERQQRSQDMGKLLAQSELDRADQQELSSYIQQLEQENRQLREQGKAQADTLTAHQERNKKAREAMIGTHRFKPSEVGGDLSENIKTLASERKGGGPQGTGSFRHSDNDGSGVENEPHWTDTMPEQWKDAVQSVLRNGGAVEGDLIGPDGSVVCAVIFCDRDTSQVAMDALTNQGLHHGRDVVIDRDQTEQPPTVGGSIRDSNDEPGANGELEPQTERQPEEPLGAGSVQPNQDQEPEPSDGGDRSSQESGVNPTARRRPAAES